MFIWDTKYLKRADKIIVLLKLKVHNILDNKYEINIEDEKVIKHLREMKFTFLIFNKLGGKEVVYLFLL